MLILGITKLINRAVAPRLLSLGLRLHDNSPPSSSPSLSSLVASSLLLPLAQRLVSIEVRDDYRRFASAGGVGGGGGHDNNGKSSWWDDFVDMTWNTLLEGGGGSSASSRDNHGDVAVVRRGRGRDEERLTLSMRRPHRLRMRRRRPGGGAMATATARRDDDNDGDAGESIESRGERRVHLLGRYVLPALLRSSSTADPINRSSSTINSEKTTTTTTDHRYRNNNDQFVRWIRAEYLIAKYGLAVRGAIAKYPVLRHHDDRDDRDDIVDDLNHLLPSVDIVRVAFDMEGWSECKVPHSSSWAGGDDDNGRERIIHSDHRRGSSGGNDDYDDLGDIIHHRLRGQVAHSGPLNAYFEMRGRDDSYELWTREYVRGLARYLLDRIDEMDNDDFARGRRRRKVTTVLDVGAGDGRLAYFLRLAMREIAGGGPRKRTKEEKKKRTRKNKGRTNSFNYDERTFDNGLPTIVAIDDGSWKAPIYDKENNVERLSVIESLEKYGPRFVSKTSMTSKIPASTTTDDSRLIVLCSWMPSEQDWTAAFRRPVAADVRDDNDEIERLVEEYILIGEADDGTCGHNWYTWGNPDFCDHVPIPDDDDKTVDGDHVHNSNVAPYVLDGYVRRDLEELSMLQFSRFDCKRSRESKTVSFRRVVSNMK